MIEQDRLKARRLFYEPERCGVCGYELKDGEDAGCLYCRTALCDHCARRDTICLDCPSEPEEREPDWWRALLEAVP